MKDPHTCLWWGLSCSTSQVVEGETVPVPTMAPNTLCDPCRRIVERTIDEATDSWIGLHLAIGDKSVHRAERVSGTRQQPIPLNTEVSAAMDSLVEWLVVATERVADVCDLKKTDPTPLSRRNAEHARVVKLCCDTLRPRIDHLLDLPEDTLPVWRRTGESTTFVDKSGVDIAFELVRAQKAARRLLGQTQPRFRLSLDCPSCSAPTLFRRIDKTDTGVRDEVQCDSCRISWPHSRYLQLVSIFVADEQERLAEEEQKLNAELEARAVAAEAKATQLEQTLAQVRKLALLGADEAAAYDPQTFVSFLREVLGEAA